MRHVILPSTRIATVAPVPGAGVTDGLELGTPNADHRPALDRPKGDPSAARAP